MWVKWPVRRISTGDKIALTKSATQAYLLFLFLVLVFFSGNEIEITKLFYSSFRTADPQGEGTASVIMGGKLAAKLGTHRCGFWVLTERTVFLTWKWKFFFFCFTSKNIVRLADWLAITHLRIAWDSQAHANELLRKWPTFCDTIMRVPVGLAVNW